MASPCCAAVGAPVTCIDYVVSRAANYRSHSIVCLVSFVVVCFVVTRRLFGRALCRTAANAATAITVAL
eukprot:2859320-Heterocapsa_arctica.AAC.1